MADIENAGRRDRNWRGFMDRAEQAGERFLKSRAGFIARNPGAVSQLERDTILGYKRRQDDIAGLRKHEMDMLTKRNEGAVEVAKNQGLNAAIENRKGVEATARANEQISLNNLEASKYTGDKNLEGTKVQSELQKAIEDLKGKTNVEVAGIQAESAKSVAKTNKEAALGTALVQGRATVGAATAQAMGAQGTARAAVEARLREAQNRERIAKERQSRSFIQALLKDTSNSSKWEKMSPEEKRKFLEENGQDPSVLDDLD